MSPLTLGADDLGKQFQRRRWRRKPGGAAVWPAEASVAPLMSWRATLLCPSSFFHSAHSLHPSRALETDDLIVESIFNHITVAFIIYQISAGTTKQVAKVMCWDWIRLKYVCDICDKCQHLERK